MSDPAVEYPALRTFRPGDHTRARWCPEPAQWDHVANALLKAPEGAGWDTEYYDPDGGDARKGFAGDKDVWVWSVALPTPKLHPRGYRICQSIVLPAEAFRHAGLQLWLRSPEHRKDAHNGGVDIHATEGTMRRMGLGDFRVAGVQNTLELARMVCPERVAASGGDGFGLKAFMDDTLGMRGVGAFSDLFVEELYAVEERTEKAAVCSCGVKGCRKRKGHERPLLTVKERVLVETRPVWLPRITPEHPLHTILVPYAGEDAEAARALRDWLERVGSRINRPMPW